MSRWQNLLSLFNNAIIEAQQVIKPSCFFPGINLSLLNFADDILHVSRSISFFQQNYDSLAAVYKEIGLSSNESKTELFFFNGTKNELSINLSVKIGDTLIKPCESLTGLTISSSLKDTRSALTTTSVPVYERLTDYLLPISIVSTVLSLPGYTMLLLPHICLLWFSSGKYSQLPKRKPFAVHSTDMLCFSCIFLRGTAMATSPGNIRSPTLPWP